MLHCKDCEKYKNIATETIGVCSLPECYFPVCGTDPCAFLHVDKKTCGKCDRLGQDFACMSQMPDDDATKCPGFIDRNDIVFQTILCEWLKTGEYNKEKIRNLCAEFESTELYKFILQHSDKEEER